VRPRLAVALLALILLAAAAGCGGGGNSSSGGGGGSSPANDPFYGVISAEPLPDNALLTRIGQGGVGTLRINLAWGVVQQSADASYDWTHYDLVIAGAALHGIRVLATVYSSAPWAEPSAEHPPLGSAQTKFDDFVRAAVERYGDGGTFWKEHPNLPALPIADWQLWNEPNSHLFWKPAPNAAQYVDLLRGFGRAVHSADAGAKVLLGGLFPTPRGDITMVSYLTQLYQHGGGGLFDAAAVHPYAANPQRAIDATAQLRSLMNRNGDHAKPIWITEVGWASEGRPPGLVVGPQGQANYVKQIFELASRDRSRLGIAGVVWYSLSDTPGQLWVGHCGLFTVDGTPKPAWDAFTQVAGSAG
jgi:polysaccharide biosynthesis protein PslG